MGGEAMSTILGRPAGTVLQEPVFAVDGWAGNTVDDLGVEWWVTKEEGWSSSPPVRLSLVDRPERDGAFDTPSYRGPRVITLEGSAVAPDRISKEHAKDRLAAVLNDGGVLAPLVVTEPHVTRQVLVRLSAETRSPTRTAIFDCSLQLTAPDPLRYGAALNVASCPLPLQRRRAVPAQGSRSTSGRIRARRAGAGEPRHGRAGRCGRSRARARTR